MVKERKNAVAEAACCQDLNHLKNWVSDGSITLEGWTAEHTKQPPDELKLPGFLDHSLAFTLQGSDRQFRQFAGQNYDGAGHRNHFFILPSSCPSRFAWNGIDEVIVFGFQPQSLRKTAIETGCVNPDTIELQPTLLKEDRQIIRLAHLLLNEIRTNGEGTRLFTESLFTCFNVHLLRHYCTLEAQLKDYRSGLSGRHLRQTLAYIDAHLNECIQLRDLAEPLNLSPFYFCRMFRLSTGVSPYQYVLQQRIERVKRLLRTTHTSIIEISLDCGFSSSSQMSKHFKSFVGTTPSKYRKQSL